MKLAYNVMVITLMVFVGVLGGCNEADTASQNTSKAADNFEIDRRIVFL